MTKARTSTMAASSASRSPGSRCRLRMYYVRALRSEVLAADRRLPHLEDPRFVVRGPLPVVVDELDGLSVGAPGAGATSGSVEPRFDSFTLSAPASGVRTQSTNAF